MIKVVETNLSLNSINEIMDHQSRVIKIENWEEYVNEIKEGKSIHRYSYIGSLHGCTLNADPKVENVLYDDFHLRCDVTNKFGFKSKKLVYKI